MNAGAATTVGSDGSGPGGSDAALANAVADELVTLTRMLADLAADLGGDPATLRRHMLSLQAIDRISQAQLAIAGLLASTAPLRDRLDAIPLGDLAARLRSRLAA